MAEYTFLALGLSDLVVTGPDPFSSNSSQNAAAINASTLRLAPGAEWGQITLEDNDGFLEDGDGSQDLVTSGRFNNIDWAAGQNIEIEYSYVIRPLGSTDPADDITIYVLEFGSQVQGIAVSRRLSENETYVIRPGGNNSPSVGYSELVVCFTPGAGIATPGGLVAVEALQPGDLVCTADNGAQPLVWVGRQVARGIGAGMPVAVAAGILGNTRPLLLSQQHNVLAPPVLGLGRDVMVPVKALVGLPGVRFAPRPRVDYLHLLFDAHQLVLSDGAWTESFLPGPQAMQSLLPLDRGLVLSLFPCLGARLWPSVRPTLRVRPVQQRLRQVALPSGGTA